MINIVLWGIVLGSSIWVLIDAKRIGLRKGQIKGIANLGPVAWFFVCLLLWIIGFPMYLAKRGEYKRVNGKPGSSNIATIVGLITMAVYIIILIMIFTGDIKMSTADLQVQVEQNIRETWAEEPTMSEVIINSFNLVHKTGNQYKGLLEVSVEGETEKLTIDVTYDGKNFMWQVADDIKMSTADLQAQVERNIREAWAKEPIMSELAINSFTLVHKTGNNYKGLLKVSIDGEMEDIPIDVTYDGEHFMWQVK